MNINLCHTVYHGASEKARNFYVFCTSDEKKNGFPGRDFLSGAKPISSAPLTDPPCTLYGRAGLTMQLSCSRRIAGNYTGAVGEFQGDTPQVANASSAQHGKEFTLGIALSVRGSEEHVQGEKGRV